MTHPARRLFAAAFLAGTLSAVAAAGPATASAAGAYAWGANKFGQIGNGGTADQLSPDKVNGPTAVKSVAAGAEHSLAVDGTGAVWSWGRNRYGQVGTAP